MLSKVVKKKKKLSPKDLIFPEGAICPECKGMVFSIPASRMEGFFGQEVHQCQECNSKFKTSYLD